VNIEFIVNIADVLAGVGVIASLVFVGVEVRRNTSQAKLQNWASLIDRFIGIYSNAADPELANVIAKGRKDFEALTDGEKIAYGNHLYQVVVGLEAFINFAENEVHGKEEMERQFDSNILYHVGCPGGLAWYRDYQSTRPLPAALAKRIGQALGLQVKGQVEGEGAA